MQHETVTLRTCDLIGAALDWAVAKAQGFYEAENCYGGISWFDRDGLELVDYYGWNPSTDWNQGGPLIERNDWALPYRATARYHLGKYESCTPGGFPHNGETPLIAACRAIVSAHLGDSVDVPAELVGGGV